MIGRPVATRSVGLNEGPLPRILGATSLMAVAVGLMIGSGIFRVPGSVAGSVGSVGALALLWVTGGVLALFGSMTVAELACLYPEAGGVYVFLREAYGSLPAFLYGWTRLLLLVPASIGAIALIFAAYLRGLVGLPPAADRWLAGSLIAVLAAVNYRSLLWSALLENAVTAAKVVALAGVAVAAFALGGGGALSRPVSLAPTSWPGFGLALVTVMWTYSGWSSVAALGGEARDPSRTLPRALLGGVALVVVIYLVVNAAYLYVLPMDAMARSPVIAADAAVRVVGRAGADVVATLVVVSTMGAVQAALMFNPRIFLAMARDGLLPGPVGRVHERFQTPHVATLVAALLGIAYVSVRSFEQLAQAFILGVWPFHILMVWAVFRLRRRRPDADRPYRTPGYPVVPALFLFASVAMIMNALFRRPGLTLFGFGLIAAGLPVYAWIRRARRSDALR
ncbi:MAG: amino acid permease [Candidatus Palauibacterales bacterium]|nr:amino acid permease [Candidatus Palauibacterales bacterium]MDP2529195.1 amino acid permease [Candidatus Palauibacterales bacterium]MDP2584356.1 amino acid permease [Candidatus Palauibacterales bacterium]